MEVLTRQWHFKIHNYHYHHSVNKNSVSFANNTCHQKGSNLFKPGRYHSATKTHVRDRIFKLSPFHASVIIKFPEFAEITEFTESSAPFRNNSIVSETPLDID